MGGGGTGSLLEQALFNKQQTEAEAVTAAIGEQRAKNAATTAAAVVVRVGNAKTYLDPSKAISLAEIEATKSCLLAHIAFDAFKAAKKYRDAVITHTSGITDPTEQNTAATYIDDANTAVSNAQKSADNARRYCDETQAYVFNAKHKNSASLFKNPNTMTHGNSFSLGRKSFTLAFAKEQKVSEIYNISGRLKPYHMGKGVPLASSQYVNKRKAQALGKSSLNYYNIDQTSRKSALSRVRGGGSVAPKKKGAI